MSDRALDLAKPEPCWVNQTALGREFEVGSKTIGKWLQEIGLRTPERTPSAKALAEGFVKLGATDQGIPFFLWDQEMAVVALVRAGHRARNAPPPKLIGPFRAAPRADGRFDILGQEGAVAVVEGQENTERVRDLLDLAWRHGRLD